MRTTLTLFTIFSLSFIISVTACGPSTTSTPMAASLTEKPVFTESINLNTPASEPIQTIESLSTESPELTISTPTHEAAEPAQKGVIHFLIGHGEFDLSGNSERSYTRLKSALEAIGYTVSTINLLEGGQIPEDTNLVVIAGPSSPVTRLEVNQLQTFVDDGGSLVVFEDPALTTDFQDQEDPLAQYLEAFWNIKLGVDFIISPGQNSDQALSVVSGEYGQHAIVDDVEETASVYHTARSVKPIEGTNLPLVELVKTSEQTWAETDLTILLVGIAAGTIESSQPDEGVDLLGPVPLAVVGENNSGSRVAVFGDSDFASDAYINQLGNLDLAVKTIDWAGENLPLASTNETATPHQLTGEWIAFASMDQDRWDLYVVRSDGSHLTRLEGEMEAPSEVFSSGFNFSWSPDGQKIAFQADYKGNQDIFVADLLEGTFERIGGTKEDDWYPIWYPSLDPANQWIAFASKNQIMQVRPDGTGLQTLIKVIEETFQSGALSSAIHPSWSPDGRYLVAAASVNPSMIGQYDIYVRDSESSSEDATLLFSHPDANDFYPTFAPTGLKMAILSALSMASKYDLFFTDLKSEPVKISDHAAQFPFSFTWSPDGEQIAYSVQIGDRSEIFVVEPGGGKPIQITGEPLTGETIGYSEDGNRAPSWSPDSSQIAFQSNRDGNWEIYVMNADGSGQTNISNSSAMDISPSWQP